MIFVVVVVVTSLLLKHGRFISLLLFAWPLIFFFQILQLYQEFHCKTVSSKYIVREATAMESQQYGCLYKTWTIKIPFDMPMRVRETAQGPTSRGRATSTSNLLWEVEFTFPRQEYSQWLSNPKQLALKIYLQTTLGRLNRLYLYIYLHKHLKILIKE